MVIQTEDNQYSYQILVHGPGGHAKLTPVSEPVANYWRDIDSERVFGAHVQSDKSLNSSLDGVTIDPNFSAESRHIVGPEKTRNLTISLAHLNTRKIIWDRIKLSQATEKYGLRAINDDKFMTNGQLQPWAMYRSFELMTCRYILHTAAAFDAKLLQLHFAKITSGYILAGMTYDSVPIAFTPHTSDVLKPPIAAIIHNLPAGLHRK